MLLFVCLFYIFFARFATFACVTHLGLACALVPSRQHLPVREKAHRGEGGEAGGAEARGRGHRRDEGAHGRADQALLQPGSGHDPAAAQAAGLRLGAGTAASQPRAPRGPHRPLSYVQLVHIKRLFRDQ